MAVCAVSALRSLWFACVSDVTCSDRLLMMTMVTMIEHTSGAETQREHTVERCVDDESLIVVLLIILQRIQHI